VPADIGAYNIAIDLVAIMLAISGIVLGIGFATDDKKLKEFGRAELQQALINGAIVGLLISAFSSSGFITMLINNITSSVQLEATCQGFMSGNYALCFAYNYLVGTSQVSIDGVAYLPLIETAFGTLAGIVSVYVGLGLIGAIKLGSGLIGVSLGGMIDPVLSQLGYVIGALGASIVSIEAQGILLKFVALTAVQILLPVGIILRITYITRRLGGAIMAIAIGLFAVLPLTYVLNAELVAGYTSALNSTTVSTFSLNTSKIADGMMSSASSLNVTNSTSVATIFSGAIDSLESMAKQMLDLIAQIVIQVFFLPVFGLILTAISIRELARVLGSEVSFGRLYMM
jgi:hypothetical protein